ncbi:MAG: hypothetical protein HOQ05_11110 [Corynebacteriales bacterium]|nr:hypothetical protein [Mycobacteriales bacterium]
MPSSLGSEPLPDGAASRARQDDDPLNALLGSGGVDRSVVSSTDSQSAVVMTSSDSEAAEPKPLMPEFDGSAASPGPMPGDIPAVETPSEVLLGSPNDEQNLVSAKVAVPDSDNSPRSEALTPSTVDTHPDVEQPIVDAPSEPPAETEDEIQPDLQAGTALITTFESGIDPGAEAVRDEARRLALLTWKLTGRLVAGSPEPDDVAAAIGERLLDLATEQLATDKVARAAVETGWQLYEVSGMLPDTSSAPDSPKDKAQNIIAAIPRHVQKIPALLEQLQGAVERLQATPEADSEEREQAHAHIKQWLDAANDEVAQLREQQLSPQGSLLTSELTPEGQEESWIAVVDGYLSAQGDAPIDPAIFKSMAALRDMSEWLESAAEQSTSVVFEQGSRYIGAIESLGAHYARASRDPSKINHLVGQARKVLDRMSERVDRFDEETVGIRDGIQLLSENLHRFENRVAEESEPRQQPVNMANAWHTFMKRPEVGAVPAFGQIASGVADYLELHGHPEQPEESDSAVTLAADETAPSSPTDPSSTSDSSSELDGSAPERDTNPLGEPEQQSGELPGGSTLMASLSTLTDEPISPSFPPGPVLEGSERLHIPEAAPSEQSEISPNLDQGKALIATFDDGVDPGARAVRDEAKRLAYKTWELGNQLIADSPEPADLQAATGEALYELAKQQLSTDEAVRGVVENGWDLYRLAGMLPEEEGAAEFAKEQIRNLILYIPRHVGVISEYHKELREALARFDAAPEQDLATREAAEDQIKKFATRANKQAAVLSGKQLSSNGSRLALDGPAVAEEEKTWVEAMDEYFSERGTTPIDPALFESMARLRDVDSWLESAPELDTATLYKQGGALVEAARTTSTHYAGASSNYSTMGRLVAQTQGVIDRMAERIDPFSQDTAMIRSGITWLKKCLSDYDTFVKNVDERLQPGFMASKWQADVMAPSDNALADLWRSGFDQIAHGVASYAELHGGENSIEDVRDAGPRARRRQDVGGQHSDSEVEQHSGGEEESGSAGEPAGGPTTGSTSPGHLGPRAVPGLPNVVQQNPSWPSRRPGPYRR